MERSKPASAAGKPGFNGRPASAALKAEPLFVRVLCRQSVSRLKLLQNPTNLPELVTYLKRARPIQAHFLEQARTLSPPLKDEPDWKRALAFDEKVLTYYDEMAAAAKRNDRNNLRRVTANLRALPAKNPYELRLGLQGC